MFGQKKDVKREQSILKNGEGYIVSEYNVKQIKEEDKFKRDNTMASLASTARIKGTLKFNGTMRVDGDIEGEIVSESGELIVSETGTINASIKTKSAIINGRVAGEIVASEKIVLRKNAHLIGDLQAKTLSIEEGVVFVGHCNVNPEGVQSVRIARSNQPEPHNENNGQSKVAPTRTDFSPERGKDNT